MTTHAHPSTLEKSYKSKRKLEDSNAFPRAIPFPKPNGPQCALTMQAPAAGLSGGPEPAEGMARSRGRAGAAGQLPRPG